MEDTYFDSMINRINRSKPSFMKTYMSGIVFLFALAIVSYTIVMMPSEPKFTIHDQYVVNDNLVLVTNQGTIEIELVDEQDNYFFAARDKEYQIKQYRDNCRREKNVFLCDNFTVFQGKTYKIDEGL